MKLEGYRRLEAHVPTELWDEIEKARGQMTRSEFTRQALRAQLDYPSMLAAPKETNGDVVVDSSGITARNALKTVYSSDPTPPAKTEKAALPANTAREILLARTRLMRGNNS